MGQPEGKLARKIISMLHEHGAYAWKNHGNEFMPVGLPDIVGVYRGRMIAIEVKMPGNDLAPMQVYRIERIRTAGGLVLAPCYTVDAAREWLIGEVTDTITNDFGYTS